MNMILCRFDPFSRDAMPYRMAVRWTSVLFLGALAGCSGLGGRNPLREDLFRFANYFQRTAERTAIDVQGKEYQDRVDPERSHIVELWRSRFVQECNTAISRDDPVRGLLDVWMLSQRALDCFETKESADFLGESQAIVLNAAREVHNRVERIAALYLKERVFDDMRKKVTEGANADPIRSNFPDGPSYSDTEPGKKTLKVVLDMFVTPFRAVGELVQASSSTLDWPGAVDRFSEVIDEIPRKAREEAVVLLDRVDKSHPKLQSTVVEVRQTAQSVEHTLAGVPKAAEALEALVHAIGRAKKETGTLWYTPDCGAESAPPESKEPFSFQQVTDSAEAYTRTVAELRELVHDLRDFLESDALSRGSGEIRRILPHATGWAALLMLLAFALTLLYRAIANRFRTAHPPP